MHKGYLPDILDHIDGNKLNNRIENLRECTEVQNCYNAKTPKNNTSGIKGVSWSKRLKKWRAQIQVNGKKKSLGFFFDKEVADQIIRIERARLHGEFSNNG